MTQRLAYPITEAAQQLGISRSRLYLLKSEGRIEFTKIDSRSVVTAAELERFLADQPTTGLLGSNRSGAPTIIAVADRRYS